MTKLAKLSYKAFSYRIIPELFLKLRSYRMEQMKGSNALKKSESLAAMFSSMLMQDILIQPLTPLTQSVKVVLEAFS